MASKADLVRFYLYCDLWAKYVLGNEPYYDIYGEPSTDPLASDCSGLMIGVMQRAGVRFNGLTLATYIGTPRPTADAFYRKATKIENPTKFGDMFFLVYSSGRAHHIGMYVGNGRTVESGDGTGKTAEHTVAWQNARGAVWGRLSGHDMGSLTAPGSADLPVADWGGMYLGSYGTKVRELKTLLKYVQGSNLTLSNTVTGKTFGPVTLREVKRFQRENKKVDGTPFAQTGRVGPDTMKALMRALD